MKRIAVLGANKSSLPFYKQARKLGYFIVGIAWEEGAICKDYCDVFYPVSYADKDEVLQICKAEKVDGIISFTLESALPTLVYVAQKLGLVSNSDECLKLTQSKFAQRQALEIAGIPVPKYYLIENEGDLEKVQCSFPVIVKPVDSGGSQGIYKVDSPDSLTQSYRCAVGYSRSSNVIVEEFVDGREFSVEYISHQGKHFFLQITDKVTSGSPHFVEMQHHQPAAIPESVCDRIKIMVEKALNALKIQNSASHTEIKWNSHDELFIIEIGARMGGDYITSDLVRLSTGYNFVEGAIKLAVNQFEEPLFSKKNYSGVYFYNKLAPEVGDIIRHHDKYPEIVECNIEEGPLVEVLSNADRSGYFLYQTKHKRFNPFEK